MSQFSFGVFSPSTVRSLRTKHVKADEVLFAEGNPVEYICRVRCGSMRLVAFPENGKQLVLYRALAGEVFAEEHLTREYYGYTAIASEKTTVEVARCDLILDELASDPIILRRYLACISARYYQLRINFERIAIPTAKRRLMHLLRSMSDPDTMCVDLEGTLKSLADDLNLTHEAVYRALKQLENEGRVYRCGGVIKLAVCD